MKVDGETLDRLYEEWNKLDVELHATVRDSCPGKHQVRNHPEVANMAPMWCDACGRTNRGKRMRDPQV